MSSSDLVMIMKGNDKVIAMDDAMGILDAAYGAAHGEVPWEQGLTRLADLLGYNEANLEIHDLKQGRLLHMEAARIDLSAVRIYQRDFSFDNPRVCYLKRARTRISFDHLFMTEKEMDKDRFYADFLGPQGLRYFLSVQAPFLDDGISGVLALQRSGRNSGADEDSAKILWQLEPHLSRALQVYWNRIKFKVDPDYFDRRLAGYALTGAERQLARAIAFGERLPDYARRCGISINTVYTHYRRIKEKLDCRDQATLVMRLQQIIHNDATRQTH